MSAATRPAHHLLAVVAVALLGAASYSNTLHGPFVFDDHKNIVENPAVQLTRLDLGALQRAGFESPSPSRPVANLSFALNHYLGGLEVFGYHAVNLAIHLVNGILVYGLAWITFGQLAILAGGASPAGGRWIACKALFAAALFSVHPLQTQAVSYVVQRMTSLATLFFLLAMLLYASGLRAPSGRRRWALWSACGVSGLAALGSKEIAATLPLMILLYRWYFFEDLSGAWLRRNAAGLLAVAALIALVALVYVGGDPWQRIVGDYAHRDFTLWERVLTQPRVIALYVSLLLLPLPSRLNLLHHVTTSRSPIEPIETLFAWIAIAVLLAAAIRWRRRQPLASFCGLWFLGNLVIESSVLPLEMVYEHRVYLPMLGFALLGSDALLGPPPGRRRWALPAAAAVTLALAAASHQRNAVWQDAVGLWSDVVAKNPRSHRAFNNLGVIARDAGRLEEAAARYRRALELAPDFAKAHFNLANALTQQGRLPEAEEHYRRALRARPGYAKAHLNLGNLLRQQGRAAEAERHYRQALQVEPAPAKAQRRLADLLLERAAWSEALVAYERAIALEPDDAHLRFGLAVAAGQLGDTRSAVQHYRDALRLEPQHARAANNLAWLLATRADASPDDAEEAVRWAERAERASGGGNPGVLDTLAAAQAAAGRFERAAQAAERAVALYRAAGQEEAARDVEQRLRRYRSGRPHREGGP